MAKKGELKDRTGEIHITNEGNSIKIIKYLGSRSCTVQFEDGVIRENILYGAITRGQVLKPFDRVGEIYTTNEGYIATIIEYCGRDICIIQLNDENKTVMENIRYVFLKRGKVKNPNHPSTSNIGYLGQGDYNSYSKGGSIWRGIITRCYGEKCQEKFPTYIGCSVVEEWHNFQNFAKWYEENYEPHMEGWHLDKDILQKGNKIYSPETCCFVPYELNNLFKDKYIGDLPIGMTKVNNKYQVSCHGKYLGIFYTIEKASQVYKTEKERYTKEVADKWKPLIKPKVYEAIYNYKL